MENLWNDTETGNVKHSKNILYHYTTQGSWSALHIQNLTTNPSNLA